VPRSRVPIVEQHGLLDRKQPGPHRRPAGIVEAPRAVGLDNRTVRTHPGCVSAAAGEIPAAGDPVAAWNRDPAAIVRRTPSAGRPHIAEHDARRVEVEIRRKETDAVGDRHAPADRAVGPRQFPDRVNIGRGRDLVAADRARVEHAEEPRGVQFVDQRLWDTPDALGFVRGSGDRRRQLAGPCQRVGSAHIVHRGTPRAHRSRPLRRGPDRCQ
jgi:hypothetical protein